MKLKGKKLNELISYLNGGSEDILKSYVTYFENHKGENKKAISIEDARMILRTVRDIYLTK